MNLEIVFALIGAVLTILLIIAIYFVYKSSKLMSGKLADAFYKIGAGILLLVIGINFLGWMWGYFKITATPLYQSIALGLNTAGAIFLVFGFRQLYNILNDLSKKGGKK